MAWGKTAELPLVEQPGPSCTAVVDGLEGAAFHLAERTNLVVTAKTSSDRLGTYAQERGWRNLRLLSTRNNTFNRDYHAEALGGEQLPILCSHAARAGSTTICPASDVQARRQQLPRPGLGNLRRSRFDARGTRRQRCVPQHTVLRNPPNSCSYGAAGLENRTAPKISRRVPSPHQNRDRWRAYRS